jgi:hypothetical protein
MLRNLDKHKKYKEQYKPNDFYWGLGIEHETYLESSKLKQISLEDLKKFRAAERYCVDYYSIYTKQTLDAAQEGLFSADKPILLPILLNSHSLQQCDINGEHRTTYERIPKTNKNFLGKTLFEWMKEQNPDVFLEDYEKSYIFDGDTIEFMTQKFYKTTVDNVLKELETVERDFMRAFNSLPREGVLKTYAPFQLAQENYPFAAYLTNLKNNAMFNNGTIHINITLPTQLNNEAEIADFELFRSQHQNLARVIQWISPLLVGVFGAPDPLCESKTNGEKFAAGSQRVAVSRYIGLGTYDTDTMELGKILTKKRETLKDIDWYEEFHKKVDYKFLNDLGLDFNFYKHYCHGLEFRILESLPQKDLKYILEFIVYLADFSLNNTVQNPKKSALWHRITEQCVLNGKGYSMSASDQNELFPIFNIPPLSKEPLPITEVLNILVEGIKEATKDGICVKYMIKGETYNQKPLESIQRQLEPIVEPIEERVKSFEPIVKPVETIVKPLEPIPESTEESDKALESPVGPVVEHSVRFVEEPTVRFVEPVPIVPIVKSKGWCC